MECALDKNSFCSSHLITQDGTAPWQQSLPYPGSEILQVDQSALKFAQSKSFEHSAKKWEALKPDIEMIQKQLSLGLKAWGFLKYTTQKQIITERNPDGTWDRSRYKITKTKINPRGRKKKQIERTCQNQDDTEILELEASEFDKSELARTEYETNTATEAPEQVEITRRLIRLLSELKIEFKATILGSKLPLHCESKPPFHSNFISGSELHETSDGNVSDYPDSPEASRDFAEHASYESISHNKYDGLPDPDNEHASCPIKRKQMSTPNCAIFKGLEFYPYQIPGTRK
ncbi:hypothetical protein HYALB_00004702 [Hymenoscyphus albidus]|uniref:Uncharacterized protein n=1 Tax=Hymenoscyphus albidus TaxID=595503 RepID=A0A9N9Q872_9HELO|nr:hypothetical protein HYALB_00004702 [Hymenoscyphus albidus]